MRLKRWWVVLALALVWNDARAQDVQRRYLPNPADEDWSFLAGAPRVDPWDRLKYVPLGRAGWFMTVSGELRYRPEGFRIRPTADRDSTVDNYLLQRYLVGSQIRMGARTRVFVEVQSGVINGAVRSPRPTDRNRLDLHQAVISWQAARGTTRLTVDVGRQELAVGSTRLISASPGLNVKRSFDGIESNIRAASWTIAAAVARLVAVDGGSFDDRSSWRQPFWGVAASRRSPRFQRGELGGYYLGIDRPASTYYQGVGHERRHTLGVKWTGNGTRVDLNYDALWQWGRFADAPIRAWAFATETGFRPTLAWWRPRISVRADVASGDSDPADRALHAFNPLFPGNSYSGAVGLLGPTNLTDFTPAVVFVPRPGLTLGFEAPSYWRTSTGDGVYATDQRLLVPPTAGATRYVGTNPGILAVWQATRHLQAQGVITRFLSGAFLDNTFAGPGFGFYSLSGVYRF